MLAKHSGKTLLKGGRVIDPASNTDAVLDVLIDGDVIAAVGPNLPEAGVDTVVQLTPDHWVTPGLVDIHVHFRDPGRPDKETTATGAASALAGGFTSVCIMPNTTPTLDSLSVLEYIKQVAQRDSKVNIYAVCAATKGLAGEELTEIGSLYENGAVAFTDDGHCLMNANLMRLALQYAKMFDAPVVCHAEDMNLSGHGCMNEGYYSTLLGLPGIPNIAESVIVGRDIELARETGGHVHFAHVSTAESVDLIRKAKAEGVRVSGETTPHYLTLTDAAVQGYDPDFKMNPPLPSESDRQALIKAVQDGTIEAIATDHAPHTPDEKSLEFDKAPNGVVGLETSLAVMLTHFVHTGLLTPLQLIDRMATSPARLLKLPAGTLDVGAKADVTVIDPNEQWVVDPSQFKSKSRNSPFKGMTLSGRPKQVYSAGECVLGEDWSPSTGTKQAVTA
jgi:dihydroorotase